MAKKEEKAKVGRPKLAEPELIKESWISIAACLVVALVMVICGAGVLTGGKVFDSFLSNEPSKLQGSAVKVIPAQEVTVIPAKKVSKKVIGTDGTVSYVIPANEVKTIKVSD